VALLDRFAESERESAPSIVPSMDDAVFWLTAPNLIEPRSYRPDGPKCAAVAVVCNPKAAVRVPIS
jgi:hypothetical protein